MAVVALLVIGMLPAVGADAAAARVQPRTKLADVEQEVMCPTCGTPLMVAQSPLADRERAFIQVRIARGETEEQIKRDMVAEFGPSVLATPAGRGFQLSAYSVPAAAVGLALVGLLLGLWRWRDHRPGDAPDRTAALSPRLEDDLARYDV